MFNTGKGEQRLKDKTDPTGQEGRGFRTAYVQKHVMVDMFLPRLYIVSKLGC